MGIAECPAPLLLAQMARNTVALLYGVVFVLFHLGVAQGWGGEAEPSRIVPHLRPGPSHLVVDFLTDEDTAAVTYDYVVAYKYSPTEEQRRAVAGILPMGTLFEGVLSDMFYTERRTLGENKELIKAQYVGPVAFRAPAAEPGSDGVQGESGDVTVVKGWETLQLSGEGEDIERRVNVLQYYDFPENGVYRFKVNTHVAFLFVDGSMEERQLYGNTRSLMVDNVHLQELSTIEDHLATGIPTEEEAISGDGVKWHSCSQQEIDGATTGLKNARLAIEAAVELLEHSVEHDGRLESYFGALTAERREAIVDAYRSLLKVQVDNIRCDASECDSDSNVVGYVYPWDSSHSIFLCLSAKAKGMRNKGTEVTEEATNCHYEDVDQATAGLIGLLALFEDSANAVPMLPGRDGAMALARRHPDLTTGAVDNLAYFAATAAVFQ